MFFFQVREKSGNLLLVRIIGKGLEKSGKNSGNLIIKGFGSLQKIYLFCSREKDVLSRKTVTAPSGLLLKKRVCSPGSKFLPLRVAPQFSSDSVGTVEVKSNVNFQVCDKAIENCKISGKGQGKVREF